MELSSDPQPVYERIKAVEELNDVILPERIKAHITALCDHHKRAKANNHHQRLTFLFKGVSGAGKSMTAKAIANELGLEILRVNLACISGQSTPQIVAMFAERARLGNCMLLIDECEGVFSGYSSLGISDSWSKLLFEKFTGVAVFTTNFDVPYGFERRVTYTAKFKVPDARIRRQILHNEIQKLVDEKAVDFIPEAKVLDDLTSTFTLSGGYYQQVLQLAMARSESNSLESQALREAFEYTDKGFSKGDLGEIREPRISIDQVHLPQRLREEIGNFIHYAREMRLSSARSSMLPQGATALFSGPPGTGKTISAEAIAKEIGSTFRRVSPSSFLSMWVGETERRIRDMFREAQQENYVLFIDEAEGLFLDRSSSTTSWERTQTDELLQQVEGFKGTLIIATNHTEMLDKAFSRRFLFHMNFEAPDFETRLDLWRTWQEILGIEPTVVRDLAAKVALSGGEIRNVAIRAKARSVREINQLIAMCEEALNARTGLVEKRMGIVAED